MRAHLRPYTWRVANTLTLVLVSLPFAQFIGQDVRFRLGMAWPYEGDMIPLAALFAVIGVLQRIHPWSEVASCQLQPHRHLPATACQQGCSAEVQASTRTAARHGCTGVAFAGSTLGRRP